MTTAVRSLLLFLLSALLLGGCATSRMIDSDVQSYTSAPGAQRPATYRFERLPSQAFVGNQTQLEAMAAVALSKVDLVKATDAPRYIVQVSAQANELVPNSYADPMGHVGGWGGSAFWFRHPNRSMNTGLGIWTQPAWYRNAVHLLLRDASTGQVVYETSASFDGPWSDSAQLLPVVLDAALQGYPQPTQGPRKVVIELPAAPRTNP
ncbi:MAG: DUF4136 domain-containing protein [Rhodoferax sp.]|nr:DUF4136 domain-containing protein [Rhodoferax sp.]